MRTDWNTPQEVVDLVTGYAPIVLDPCSNATSIVPAKTRYMLPEQDGLALPWDSEPGVVFVNPPYSREIGPWIDKAIASYSDGTQIILLVPARTCTRWWRSLMQGNYARVWFRTGRLTFLGGKHCAPFPSALISLGGDPDPLYQPFDEHMYGEGVGVGWYKL